MNARPRKHSLTLRGHRTSVTLEEEFWEAFRAAALRRDMPLNQLAAQIDEDRGTECGLATAIRLFVLRELTKAAETSQQSDPAAIPPRDQG